MFFVLSKILGFFAQPSNVIVLLIAVGAVLLYTRKARLGRWLLMGGLAALLVIGLTPVGSALVNQLEQRFPPWDSSRGAPTGFIVLGGALSPDLSAIHGEPVLSDAAERLTVVADLARRYPAARIIFSGGSGSLIGGLSEADHVMPLFESFGIPSARVELENRSRNTAENATYSKQLAAPKPGERWVVVTSAFHMPRAIGAFRKAGFPVEAYPVDWQTGARVELLGLSSSVLGGVGGTDQAVREWTGLLMYWLTGRSSDLFPAPN